jgi:hypothetical protein
MPYMVADIWVQKDTLKRQHIGRLWEHQTIPALSHTSVCFRGNTPSGSVNPRLHTPRATA